ncbi:nitronate monooxygenase [Oryzisolibacter propanilivorax]|uniref:Nitronate monooxygenase n=1 Tax=Oryzisolibacter propanilivorax TaxID=1527607 RepID=A0A1G9QQB5_9BURK|nr:nitronate monooxygenase [Oryzisolibacter propanilivorax]SDM13194.1 nitronate monooxygenase [Oryzisolibacter propanilivorax]
MATVPRLLQRLSLDLPIVQGPMTGSDTPQLAAAVSEAGGLGMLGCGMRSPQAMREAAAAVRAATRRPFGMNLFVLQTPSPDPATVRAAIDRLAPLYAELALAMPEPPAQWCEDFDAQLQALIAARPAVASFTFGLLSAAQVERVKHEAGSLVIGTATTVAEARAWAEAGADAVCASGMEGGGHRGSFLDLGSSSQIGTLALVPACVDALDVPVIAAGGIMDGRGIAAALALGAQAAQLGTAFLACPESAIGAAQRAAMARAEGSDTRITRAYSGRPARGIVNAMMEQLDAHADTLPPYPVQNALTAPLRRAAAAQGRADYLSLWAGQGVGLARALPAAQLVALLEREWRAACGRVAGDAQGA